LFFGKKIKNFHQYLPPKTYLTLVLLALMSFIKSDFMRLNSSISSRGERFTILTLSISYSLISTPLLKFNMTASIASFIFTIFSLGFMACSLLVAKPSRDAAGRLHKRHIIKTSFFVYTRDF